MSKKEHLSGSFGYRFIKRTFDITCSSALLIPISLIIGVSAIVIKVEDGGPIFYMAERTGAFGRSFKMFKLRSMIVNAPDIRLPDGSTYNGEDDPRVTRFGKIARKTSIDELPQVINVLKGDMSFVGPRPDTPIGTAEYTEEERIILTVRPGITGYNQVINRNSVLTKEKLQNDIYYVRHLSLLLDIKIILMTIDTLLKRDKVYRADSDSNIMSDSKVLLCDQDYTLLP